MCTTIFVFIFTSIFFNRIGGVMVSVSSSSAVYRGFESRSGQTKDLNWYVLLLREVHRIKEKEQGRVASQSE